MSVTVEVGRSPITSLTLRDDELRAFLRFIKHAGCTMAWSPGGWMNVYHNTTLDPVKIHSELVNPVMKAIALMDITQSTL